MPCRMVKNFWKSMKPRRLGSHREFRMLLHVRERSGIMACLGAAGEGLITHDKDIIIHILKGRTRRNFQGYGSLLNHVRGARRSSERMRR